MEKLVVFIISLLWHRLYHTFNGCNAHQHTECHGDNAQYRWTLVGTNTGPGGTGRRVKISGFEEWTIGDDGLIAASLGHYDQAEYDRQVEHGVELR